LFPQQAVHNKNYKESKNKSLIGPKMKISKAFRPERLSNGETLPELLTRSRYLMVINPDKWNDYQEERAQLLFKIYPELKSALQSITDFREWYKKKPKNLEPFENERTLGNWMDEVENSPYSEIKNFGNLVANHEERIMNYHRHGNKTNAIAESVNPTHHHVYQIGILNICYSS
jgi:transposase